MSVEEDLIELREGKDVELGVNVCKVLLVSHIWVRQHCDRMGSPLECVLWRTRVQRAPCVPHLGLTLLAPLQAGAMLAL